MADKPSRGLVLYGDGLAPAIGPSHSHLHLLASKACCGFLSLPHSPPSESEEERIVREFAHLLDAHEAYADMGKEDAVGSTNGTFPTISDRFMGLKAAVVTNSLKLRSFIEKLGCTVLQHELWKEAQNSLDQEPPVDAVCNDLLNLLGIQGGKVLATSPFDLVFVHIGAGECVEGTEEEVRDSGIEYANSLAGRILHLAQPGSEIGSRLHLSLVMSYGGVSSIDSSSYSTLASKDGWSSELSKLYHPRQSYTMQGESPREDVRHHCPMLVAQWQDAVTRRDMAELFSFEDFKERGGNLVIPADRMLHEIAFKLWKAPKYGA